MQDLPHITNLLGSPQSICITTHQNPDADALGSSLALAAYLTQYGHTVTILSSTAFPDNLAWMQGSASILILENNQQKNQVIEALNNSTILFCLDFNVPSRTKGLTPYLQSYNGIKVIIDHHEQPALDFFNYGISNPQSSSTCQMIYEYIVTNNDGDKITQAMAECIYAGTMTDTGSFRFSSTQASTHIMVADLLGKGVVPNYVHQQIFDVFPERRLRLLGKILTSNLTIIADKKVAYITLSKEDNQAYNVQMGDTEGFVNYPFGIQGIDMCAFINEKDDELRMSFRSKGDVDVNEFARTYFNGGGHKNAAGGRGTHNLETTVNDFLTALKQWKY
jgi:bifunctional oligoribonuclease and PAP phosphatase NrnA